MSDVQGVNERNWILTLFIRDDGERFLLGDGAYEFKDTQKHFTAPTVENDTVEVQGNDGIMLAGQVRRPNTQEFDGFVGDATATKEEIEEKRKAFLGFFLTRHTYTAIYIFENGKAIQRRGGFIVDAPEVKELWQIHPEYHVALNFEDINYYNYAENEEGQEIFANIYRLINTRATSGGLVWDEIGVVWDEMQAGGKNLFEVFPYDGSIESNGLTLTQRDGWIVINGTTVGNGWTEICADFRNGTTTKSTPKIILDPSKEYTFSFVVENLGGQTFSFNFQKGYDGGSVEGGGSIKSDKITFDNSDGIYRAWIRTFGNTTFDNVRLRIQLEEGSEATPYEPFIPAGGAVWESGSGETENNINVESIETVYPVLTITGMAQNIVVENSRTGDVLEYIGNVASGQTLVIDMQNQTAKLNGVNVVGNIVGDWLRLMPGQNRVLYDANTDENSEATLEWQEIVG